MIIYPIIEIIKINFIKGVLLMIIFDKLWETMKNKRISTYKLIEKHNIDTRTIRRLKANKNTTTHTLNKLCVILNCRLEDVAEYIDD